MDLWLPDNAVRAQQEMRQAYAAEVGRQASIRHEQNEWDRRLREVDPLLRLRKALEGSDLPGLKPGYWYVIRHNQMAPPSLLCVEGPNGEYREPDSQLFDQLREWDCWDDRVTRDRERRRERIQQAHERQRAREREERLDEAKILFKALESPSIRMGGSWTAKAGARRDQSRRDQ